MVNPIYACAPRRAKTPARLALLCLTVAAQAVVSLPSQAQERGAAVNRKVPALSAQSMTVTGAAIQAPSSQTPALPPAVTPLDLATIQDIDALSVSPDGRNAVFVLRRPDPVSNSYSQRWMITSLGTGETRALADAGEPIFRGSLGIINGSFDTPRPIWTADGRMLFYQSKRDGRIELWRATVRERESIIEKVGDFAGDVEKIVLDGQALLIKVGPDPKLMSAALEREGKSGYLFDGRFLPIMSTQPVTTADRTLDVTSNDPLSAIAASQRQWLSIDIHTGRVSPADAPAPALEDSFEGRIRGTPARGPLGREARFEARDPSLQGAYAPVTVTAVNGPNIAPIVCEHVECTGQAMRAIFWQGDEIVFARREGRNLATQAIYAWNSVTNSLRKVFRTETGFIEPKCGQSGRNLICSYQELLRPARIVALDLSNGRMQTLFEPNKALAEKGSGYVVRRIDATTRQGTSIYGYLAKRADLAEKTLPLVMVTYRCSGFLRGGVGDEYPVLPLATEGFSVLCIDTSETDLGRMAVLQFGPVGDEGRGPGDPEKKRVQAGLDALVQELVNRGDVDPKRIGLTGLSFGAETTNYALFNMPSLTAAIASSAAITPAGVFLSGRSWRSWERWGLSDPDSTRWRSLSVSFNADHVRAPMLLNLADREMMVANEVYTALDRAGRSIESFIYPDEYHIKWQPAHRLAVYNRNIDWLNFWLRGAESGLTGDRAQYIRWRTMKDNQCRLFGPGGSQQSTRAIGYESMTDAELTPWYCLSNSTKQ